MKRHFYKFGAAALALAMSGLPVVALAESNGGDGEVNTQVGVQVPGATVTTGVSGQSEFAREQQKQNAETLREQAKQQLEVAREQQKQQLEASSSDQRENLNEDQGDQEDINLELEDDEDVAFSLDDLNQKIEVRKHQLDQEAASSTPDHQVAIEHANEVRLAVHSLLASKDLLGGIGQQVSEIAKEVDHSVASTTNAEAKLQSRGFFTRFLFGGDNVAADVISQEVAQNQQRIDILIKLLGEANVPADIQATLNAQITALQDAQARLQDLAQREQKAWGLFSWRF